MANRGNLFKEKKMVEMGQKHSIFFFKNAKNGLQIKKKWLKIGKNELKIEFVSKERKGRYGCTTYKNFPKMDKK